MSGDDRDLAADAQAALSNERTFLSWIRTALALIVTGVAVVAFDLPIDLGWRLAAGAMLLLFAIASAFQAIFGWRATARALREHEEPPDLRVGMSVTVGVASAAGLLLLGWIMS
ncbi:YidH family protein [Demequina silvatica]|uniref:YidH family protein n=1 Tax=Demequina silvatica TaxID=1638988 RepID=UPI00078633AC|nr:DUF202 domain-containing protein [Demequina silvatica]